jgi:hypothetical protein
VPAGLARFVVLDLTPTLVPRQENAARRHQLEAEDNHLTAEITLVHRDIHAVARAAAPQARTAVTMWVVARMVMRVEAYSVITSVARFDYLSVGLRNRA